MSKEILKPDVVDARTIFVGVGGIGSDIVRQVAKKCRAGGIRNVRFVCLDTNANDLRSVTATDEDIYYVQTSSTQTVGNYLAYDQDALKNWFPKNQTMYNKSVSEGSGQVRAISRLALNSTIKTGAIRPLYDAIDDLFRKDGAEMKQALRISLVSSASGGTGSGSILPLAMLLREYVKSKYPSSATIIRMTLLLPEVLDSKISSTSEMESQRRNAYATVKEINAFMMKGTGIFDTDETLSRYRSLHIDIPSANTDELKSLALLPCDFCFLVDGQNAESDTMVTLEQYKFQVALALYEQNIGPMQQSAFSMEDNVIKEFANPGNYARNRFGGIGASRICYPYEDVARYVAWGWAMDCIGGEAEAAKWSRYDKKFREKEQEAKKKFLPTTNPDYPKRERIYVDEVREGRDKFSKELWGTYQLENAGDYVGDFLDAYERYVLDAVKNNSHISAAMKAALPLSSRTKESYKDEGGRRGKAKTDLEKIRRFEIAAKMYAEVAARTSSEAVCMNENKTINEREPYTLEYLLKQPGGTIMHPNAMRYVLYLLLSKLEEELETLPNQLNNLKKNLQKYSSSASDARFDRKSTKKEVEDSIDKLCDSEGDGSKYDESFYDQLSQEFKNYYSLTNRFIQLTCKHEAYNALKQYVQDLSDAFVAFYDKFDSKVSMLRRRREDLISSLAFRSGDSVLNVLSTEPVLNELEKATPIHVEDGTMLESALCGEIFDALKTNVATEREMRTLDVVEADRRVDIFDHILLGYYENSVLNTVTELDMNIVEAIAMQYRLEKRSTLRQDMARSGESGGQLIESVSAENTERYIRSVIQRTQRLAAANIQRLSFGESRELMLCTYNGELSEMRNFRLSGIIPKKTDSVPSDTVSRHEMRFFTALYNLTPDRLDKFACEKHEESRIRPAGLYHDAYEKYARSLGADSTKDLSISTHIDKRWDSLAVLPELDFEFHAQQMIRIHKAMVYALVFQYITHRRPSLSDDSKKVFYYENSDERLTDLIVSNGTPCDEFYEILDSFYISPAIVSDVEKMKAERRRNEGNSSLNFEETGFFRAVETFTLDTLHPGRASLFEIALAYYDSLPNSLRFRDEISDLVSAVVETFRDETMARESEFHAVELMREILMEQFDLLVQNYMDNPELNHGVPPRDHIAIDAAYRKIKALYEREMPVSVNAQERINHMRAALDQSPQKA